MNAFNCREQWYGIRKESQERVGKLYKGNFCFYEDLIRNNWMVSFSHECLISVKKLNVTTLQGDNSTGSEICRAVSAFRPKAIVE